MNSLSETPSQGARSRLAHVLGWCNLLLPIAVTLFILVRTSVNIPFEDDYDAIGEFLERYLSLHGFTHRLGWILTAQHVDYKLIFLQLVVALEYALTGHVNFRFLQLLGDLAIPATALLLWLFLARSSRPLAQRVWLFAVPCYLLFSLCYFEGANWAMSGLQSLAVIAFALATLLFFTSNVPYAVLWGLFFFTLSVFASANGFAVSAVLAVLLLRQRRPRPLFAVVVLTLALAVLYSLHRHAAQYPIPAPAMSLPRMVLQTLAFPFVFLGGAAGRPFVAGPLGLAIVVAFVRLTRRGWVDRSPATFGAALFCLITAFAVALSRHAMGSWAAIAGRYRIYCILALASLYLGALDLLAPKQIFAHRRWRACVGIAAALCGLAWLGSNLNAFVRLSQRRDILSTHLILWERQPQALLVIPDEDPVRQIPVWISMRRRGQDDLQQLVSDGLYTPPLGPRDPLPVHTHSPATRAFESDPPAR